MPYLYELMRAERAETNRFLSSIGRSVNIPEMPFSEKQVDTVRYYNQYQGSDMEYIPPGLTLEDLSKLGKIDSSLFEMKGKLFSSVTRGGWVATIYGVVPKSVGLDRAQNHAVHTDLVEKFGLSGCFVDFGNILDHLYLKLKVLHRTSKCLIGDHLIWTNEFDMDSVGFRYLVIGYKPQFGLYMPLWFSEKGSGVGSSPLIYPTHPIIRPRE